MSGRTKRMLYSTCVAFLGVLALAATVVLGFFGAIRAESQLIGNVVAILVFGIFSLLLPVSVLVHELGHLLFGAIAGLRFVSFFVSRIEITPKRIYYAGKRGFSGETQMLPKKKKGVRARTICFAFGGALLNLLFGTLFLTFFFVLPAHPVLLFFELCAPLNLFEGISALLPAELDSGRTDGKILAELIIGTPYSKVFLAVLTAQGLLYKQGYQQIPREFLFDLPVVREDEPAFLALTQLRWQYLYMTADEEGAAAQIKRLESISDYLSDEVMHAEIVCDIAYSYAVFADDKAHAEELFSEAEAAKGTAAYMRTQYALYGGDETELHAEVEKLPAFGVKELEKKLVSRAKSKKNSAFQQNSEIIRDPEDNRQ